MWMWIEFRRMEKKNVYQELSRNAMSQTERRVDWAR